MDIAEIIMRAIGAIVLASTMMWLATGAKKTNARSKDHRNELRLPMLYMLLGGLCLLIFSIYPIMLIVDYSTSFLYISIPVMMLFGGLGLPMFLAYFNHRVFFNEKYFRVRSWRNQVKEVEWSEIKHASFNRTSGYLRLESQNDKYYVNTHLVGFIEFFHELNRHTGYNARTLNIPNF